MVGRAVLGPRRPGEGRHDRRRSRWPTFAAHNLPDGVEPTLDAEATYDPDNFSFPHGTHLCATEVDTETGMVKIRSYVAVDDVGKVVNPLIVEGQVHGGIAQGIAQALFEEAVYDDAGNLLTTTLADYLVPSAADLPSFTTDRTREPGRQPAGRQGRGRGGHDRVHARRSERDRRRAPPVRHRRREMPCTPERVWRAIQAAQDGGQGSAAERHEARQSNQTQGNSPQGAAGHRRGTAERRRGVIPAKFDYIRPGSLDEAVHVLGNAGDDAKVIAGGQSLMPLLRLRLA